MLVKGSSHSITPCMLLAMTGAAGVDANVHKQSIALCKKLGLQPPAVFNPDEQSDASTKVYKTIIATSLQPDRSIPETEEQRLRKEQEELMRRLIVWGSLTVGAVGAGLYAYKWYKRAYATT